MMYHKFNKLNVAGSPKEEGLYKFFDVKGTLIYVGSAHNLRHRLSSYYQCDSFTEHPTKEKLRRKIAFFTCEPMPMARARKIERKTKWVKMPVCNCR